MEIGLQSEKSHLIESVFEGSLNPRIIDFLALQDNPRTGAEICKGTGTTQAKLSEALDQLIKSEIIAVNGSLAESSKNPAAFLKQTYYMRDDTIPAKAIWDLYNYIRFKETQKPILCSIDLAEV
ncbi:MAG: hypothetical protein ACREAW_04545 [Nitrososphaera sp.]